MLEGIRGFDWDAANLGHILRHAVTPFEVEESVLGPNVTIPARSVNGENRWKLFGKTRSNRYIVVVFAVRHELFRTVTAYDMNAAERKTYAAKIE
jgi:uncharacterized DUF497 family protein